MQWICQKFHTTLLNLVQNSIVMKRVCGVEFLKNPHHTNDFCARDRNQPHGKCHTAHTIHYCRILHKINSVVWHF